LIPAKVGEIDQTFGKAQKKDNGSQEGTRGFKKKIWDVPRSGGCGPREGETPLIKAPWK